MGRSSSGNPAADRGNSIRLDLRRAGGQCGVICLSRTDDVFAYIRGIGAIYHNSTRARIRTRICDRVDHRGREPAAYVVLCFPRPVSCAPFDPLEGTVIYLLTDEAYAPTVIHYEKEGITPFGHFFLSGAGLALWTNWQISTALGILLGAAIPKSWSLDFALPLTFIAMVVPVLKNRPAIAAALSAGVVALFAYTLPYKLGLIVAALVGITVGTVLENRKPPKETSSPRGMP